MNIALMAHDRKKELMVQFCIAYCGILQAHSICATNTTGRLVKEATGLPIELYLSCDQGGDQQMAARLAYNELDLVLFFSDPTDPRAAASTNKISATSRTCPLPPTWPPPRSSYGDLRTVCSIGATSSTRKSDPLTHITPAHGRGLFCERTFIHGTH